MRDSVCVGGPFELIAIMATPALVSRKAKRKLAREEKKRSRNKRQRGSEPEPQTSRANGSGGGGKRGSNRPRGGRQAAQSAGMFVNRFHELVEETTGTSSAFN